jgi:hypothetical protein
MSAKHGRGPGPRTYGASGVVFRLAVVAAVVAVAVVSVVAVP